MNSIVAFLLSILTGLGVGGGGLLILWLGLVTDTEQYTAQGINLLFFLAAGISAFFVHLKKRDMDWRTLLPTALSGCLFSLLGAFLAGKMDGDVLKRCFGGLMLATGVVTLFMKQKKD